nr:MAG TPA: DNA-directed RNA polymerase subunit K [Caudoviricetes sp.]
MWKKNLLNSGYLQKFIIEKAQNRYNIFCFLKKRYSALMKNVILFLYGGDGYAI